jgi:hypothetical protein
MQEPANRELETGTLVLVRPLLGGWGRLWGSFLEARRQKKLVELPLHGAWDWVKRT